LRSPADMTRSIVGVLGIAALGAGAAGCNVSRNAADSSAGEIGGGDTVGVVLAAGDIAMCTSGAAETAELLDSLAGEVIVVGDAAYESKRDRNPYRTCYDSTWGRHKKRTHPVMGNHDLQTRGMYFAYFGEAAGPRPGGYYSFDVGPWHVLALNSNIAMDSRSHQGKWAAADLAAHAGKCTLAYMHHPRFSSGPHSRNLGILPMWRLLDSAGVELVVSGHDHIYERFAPMHENGERDDERGVRQFIAGTGGAPQYGFATMAPNSEVRSNRAYGLLKLTLYPARYTWEFVPTAASDFSDAGSGTCH